MARKNNRQVDPNDDSSDSGGAGGPASGSSSTCKHISRAVQLGAVKKKLKNGIRTSCDTCAKNPKQTYVANWLNSCPKQAGEEVTEVTDENLSYWLCLACAHVGCGRGQFKHAIEHHNRPRSEPHDVVVDIDSWIVWCYPCEQKMAMNSTKKLQECVEYVRRHIQTSKPLAASNSCEVPVNSGIVPASGKEDISNALKSSVTVDKKNAVVKRVVKLSKVRGLMNLGNTCFYNSVLQCLSVTPYLTSTLKKLTKSGETFILPGNVKDDTFEAPSVQGELRGSGPLTNELLSLLLEMRNPEMHADTLRPQKLLKNVQDAFPQFRGNEQHDAHELLRHLLEGVRSDDLKRFQRVILIQNGLINQNIADIAVDVKKKMKLYGQQLQDFILGVEGIFKGQLVSIVECQDCLHHSTRFESFLDLSLPVMEDKPWPPMRKKEQTEISAVNSGPSKHQLKKQKKVARRNSRAQKSKRSEKMDGCNTILEEPVKDSDGPESEESDADVEDNVEQDSAAAGKDKEVVESGYSSEKHNTGESDGTSPSIAAVGGEREVEGEGEGGVVIPSTAVAVPVPVPAPAVESPTAPVTASTSSEGPSPSSPPCSSQAEAPPQPQTQTQPPGAWSSLHAPDHNCSESTCNFSCKGNVEMRCFSPIDEELRITIPESGEGSIHISPLNPSERPVSRCDFFPGEMQLNGNVSGNFSKGMTENFTPELETRLLSLCLDENKRAVEVETMGSLDRTMADEVRKDEQSEFWGKGSFTANNNNNIEDNNNNCDDDYSNSNDNANKAESLDASENFNDGKLRSSDDILLSGKVSEIKLNDDNDDKEDKVSGWCKTLAPRHQSEEGECSIISCLNQFTSLELMTGNNKVGCEACTQRHNKGAEGKTVYTNSTKQFLISSPPPVLILHLKRFMMDNFRFKKLQRFVSFPLELDIAPFCSSKCKDSSGFEEAQTEVKYSLFGVVEHTGSLNTGHYIAYIKIRPKLNKKDPRWSFLPSNRTFVYPKVDVSTNACPESNDVEEKWYSVSDSRVVEIAEAKVLKLQAYLLFYERIV